MPVNTEALFKAKQDLNQFLAEHPELVEQQGKIDAALRKCGDNPHNRMAVLRSLMRESLSSLGKAMGELKEAANKLSGFNLDR